MAPSVNNYIIAHANKLFYGDNLEVLRKHIPDASVDLVYLDPPFQSGRNYNLLFEASAGGRERAQAEAFQDTWHWSLEAEASFDEVTRAGGRTGKALRALRSILGDSDMMAYLCMMAPRLLELHRALKRTGSLYLHCDPTASHYLKVLLDSAFGPDCFLNEIVWKRTFSHGDPRRNFGAVTDTILLYARSEAYFFAAQSRPFTSEYAGKRFATHEAGRRWQSVTLRSPSPRPNLTYDYEASNGVVYAERQLLLPNDDN